MARLVKVRSLRRRGDVTVRDNTGARKVLKNNADTVVDLDRADNRLALSRVWSDVVVSQAEAIPGSRVSLETFTAATRPAANSVPAGTVIFVSDGGAGAVFQGSTGSAWVNLG